ncbi:DNA-binding protein [Methylobacterium sp. J-070]|uniref:DNA-binding protein n=1 Tax=Methylobacterium sp. J-070 TaxID=2836650 RepID=UPI001FBB3C17|nr:DNA-binding protein [Methylobacterium sp. J-070]MCJ2053704.1 DNA-binding protein [Methylobacterium sp. J-070]
MAMETTMTAEERAEALERPLVPVKTAGLILGLSLTPTFKAIASGDIPTITINNRRYVPTARLREMIEGRVGQSEKAA